MESKIEVYIETMVGQAQDRRDKYLEVLIVCSNAEFPMWYEKYKQSQRDHRACLHVIDIIKRSKGK